MIVKLRRIIKFVAIALLSALAIYSLISMSYSPPTNQESMTQRKQSGLSRNKSTKVKYYRCPEFHTAFRMDGLNIFKEKLLGFLGEIMCAEKDRVILMPPLLNHGDMLDGTDGKQYLIPFDSVFDLEKLNKFTAPIRLVADSIKTVNWSYKGFVAADEVEHTFRESSLGFPACKRIITTLPLGITCPPEVRNLRDTNALKSLVAIVGRERTLDAILATEPAPKLSEIARKFLETKFPQGTQSLICVHLRTEDDFKALFREPPKYYTEEQYFRKIKWHMSTYPELYQNISNVFIAGDHSEDYINNMVRPLFKQLFKGGILGHESIKPFGYGSLENIQRAAIDQHICARSNIFIGNAKSGFSQMTHYLRKAMYRDIELPNIKDHMINNPNDTLDNVSDHMLTDISHMDNYDIFH